MAHTIIAWSKSLQEAGADVALDAVSDPTVHEAGTYIYCPTLNQLIGAYAALGTTAVSAYLEAPSLRASQNFYIEPIENTLVSSGVDSACLQPASPLALIVNEGIRGYANASPAAAEQHTILAFLADAALAPVAGPIIHAKATAAAVEAAGAWKMSELTFAQDLASGRYQIVGAHVRCAANGIAFRVAPIGEFWRPGGLCVNDIAKRDPVLQRNGGLGVWSEFTTETPPSIEVLASAAGGTSQDVILDLIKVA